MRYCIHTSDSSGSFLAAWIHPHLFVIPEIKQPVRCVVPSSGLEKGGCRTLGSLVDTYSAQLIGMNVLDDQVHARDDDVNG